MAFKVIDVEQGTDEWLQARLGHVTASVASETTTAKTLKPSASASKLANRLAAELILGKPTETFMSDAMARGKELEPEAFAMLSFATDFYFESTGFVKADGGLLYGVSPDGVDWTNKVGLELKCPMAHTHVGYLSGEPVVPSEYWLQVQMSLWVTEFDRWIFASYYPGLPIFYVEVLPCKKTIGALKVNVEHTCNMVFGKYEIIKSQLLTKGE